MTSRDRPLQEVGARVCRRMSSLLPLFKVSACHWRLGGVTLSDRHTHARSDVKLEVSECKNRMCHTHRLKVVDVALMLLVKPTLCFAFVHKPAHSLDQCTHGTTYMHHSLNLSACNAKLAEHSKPPGPWLPTSGHTFSSSEPPDHHPPTSARAIAPLSPMLL